MRKIEDPIGLLPPKLILGINKRGVHFFRPVPKEYLHSAELRDIMQFGSSSQAVFFKMRVAGVLHIFQFDTRQGEDICMALQTHINDIMMKRYSKVGCLLQRPGAYFSFAGKRAPSFNLPSFVMCLVPDACQCLMPVCCRAALGGAGNLEGRINPHA